MTAGEICGYIDGELINVVHTVIVVIKIAVPILLIIFGMLDFAKGVMGNSEDEIKKGQKIFIKRVIAAIIVFFIVSITQFVMSIVSTDSEIWNCASAIMNGTNSGTNINIKPKTYTDEDKNTCCTSGGGTYSNGTCTNITNQNAYDACMNSRGN